ncbi:hypothetical protein [Demequina soli]|uniref:hypothetical protein n=1 Tax=Demequina soli TaxID=1638987 RepID=UPI000782A9FD|nr:hypothetical protein [Demequina soli]
MDQSFNDELAAQARLQQEQLARMHHQQAMDDAAQSAGRGRPFPGGRHGAGDPLVSLPARSGPLAWAFFAVWAVISIAGLVLFIVVAAHILGSWDDMGSSGPTTVEIDGQTVPLP